MPNTRTLILASLSVTPLNLNNVLEAHCDVVDKGELILIRYVTESITRT